MHSTSGRPSLSKRCGRLPCMSWQLGASLRQLRIVFASLLLVPLLLLVGEQRGQPKQWRRGQQPCKGEMVATRLFRVVHANRGAGAHADP